MEAAEPKLSTRVAIVEMQMHRLISDMDSEKGTRARSHVTINEKLDRLDDRQRKLERVIYMGLGGLAVLQFLIPLSFGK